MGSMIVKRGELDKYEQLYKAFGSRVPVVWDRRRANRRRLANAALAEERRRNDRRGSPQASWRLLGFVVTD